MAYLGRGLDKISNIEVLDNITFDGSSSYSITKGSVAFTPNSAQSCLISIDGVVQAANFTVSSSTINFGVAVPSTSTCNFFLHYGTGVMTVPSDGSVTTAKLGDGAVTSAKLSAGKVLQVVRNSSTTTVSTSTHSSQTELINASITPTSTSSKILILINVMVQTTGSSNSYSAIKTFRGTISGTGLQEYYFGSADSSNRNDLYSINTIDEPSTTSSQQYTVGIRKGSSSTASVSTDGGLYEIILMEIQG